MGSKGGRQGKTPGPRPAGRAGSGTAAPPIEIVYFPKRTAPLPTARRHDTDQEIHTERIEPEQLTETVTHDPTHSGESGRRHITDSEIQTEEIPSMRATPQEIALPMGKLEDPMATLAYHRARLREMVATTPPDRPLSDTGDLSLFAHSLLEQRRLGEARVVFEGIVSREPDLAFPYAMLGSVYQAQGEDDRALALYEAALQIDANDPAARVHRAEIRLKRGDVAQAIRDLDKVLASDPDAREDLTPRAQLLRRRAERRRATRDSDSGRRERRRR